MDESPDEEDKFDEDEDDGAIGDIFPNKQVNHYAPKLGKIPSFYDDSADIKQSGIFERVSVQLPKVELASSQELLHSPHYSVPLLTQPIPATTEAVDNSHTFRRPGTPALCIPCPETTLPYNIYGDSQYDFHPMHPLQASKHASMERLILGNRGSGDYHKLPPYIQPPSTPSQLYALLLALQGTRPLDATVGRNFDQSFGPSQTDTSHSDLLFLRNAQQNERLHRVGETAFRATNQYLPSQSVFGQFGDVARRQVISNINHLPHNMVRLKPTGVPDQSYMERNGAHGQQFPEDDEGNHECHSIQPGTNQVSPPPGSPVFEAHNSHTSLNHEAGNGTDERLLPSPEVTVQDGISALGASIYQGEWPINRELWVSGPSSIGEKDSFSSLVSQDTESIMSFSSSAATTSARRSHSHQLGTKVEMVYSLLSMLGSNNVENMSRTLLAMSSNQDSCIAMRQSGCLPLLIQLLHGGDRDSLLSEQDPQSMRCAVREARRRASQALHNIVHAHPDDKRGRREARVLRLLEQIRDYSDYLRDLDSESADLARNDNLDLHPGPAIAALMKLSFDEEHRHAMCQLGGLQAIAELIQANHEVHGNTCDRFCITVRRYAGMALTNLTFGDGTNKALLCSMKSFMQALVAQLHSQSEDLRQVTASVLRNLSWRADAASKQILREVGAVTTLMKAAMEANKESTLKSILSALWNLSAHCSMNKADICAIDGALAFLVSTLTYKSASKTLSIIENGGGILRNISSHIAIREDYRAVLRKHKCLQTLLSHLKSPSLTVVSNACGTLWNLSARCPQDQQALWEMGAVGMLRNLVHSKHKMISMGSSAALKNLLAARPPGMGIGLGPFVENGFHVNGGSRTNTPSLLVRKQKALEAEIDQNLSETCDNLDSPKTSPTPQTDASKRFMFDVNGVTPYDRHKPQYLSYLPGRMYHSINGQVLSPIHVPRSDSKDSVGSTHSEPPHYRAQRERFRIFVNNNKLIPMDSKSVQERPSEWKEKTNLDYEDNSNIVIQLFRSLHKNALMEGAMSNGNTSQNGHLLNNVNKQPTRPNTLPTQRRDVPEMSRFGNKFMGRNIQEEATNGAFSLFSHANGTTENGHHNVPDPMNYDRTPANGCLENTFVPQMNGTDEQRPGYHDNSSNLNVFLEFPENKRPLDKNKLSNNMFHYAEKPFEELTNGHSHDHSASQFQQQQQQQQLPVEGNVLHGNKQHADAFNSLQDVVVLRRRPRHESKRQSSTFSNIDNDDQSTDQTPLVGSRCSSISSLTSCIQQSARSSWVSDISQRTSGIISPTDLPDSPGLGSSEDKHRVSEFTDKAPDPESHGVIRPRPSWPSTINSTPQGELLTPSEGRPSSESERSSVPSTCLKISDTQKIYLAEDRIGVHSGVTERETVTPPDGPQNTPEKDSCSSTESSSPQDDERDQENQDGLTEKDLLAKCISLGMPNNSSGGQHNNSKLHSKVNNLSSCMSYPRSGIPVKANNVRLTQSVPNVTRPILLSSCAAAVIDSARLTQNIVEHPEGASGSYSNLSRAEQSEQQNFDNASYSSVCDDNDNLLFRYSESEDPRVYPKSYYSQKSGLSDTSADDASPSVSKSKLPFPSSRKPDVQPDMPSHNQKKISSKDIHPSKKYPPSTHTCGFSHSRQGSRSSDQSRLWEQQRRRSHRSFEKHSSDSESDEAEATHSAHFSSSSSMKTSETFDHSSARWLPPSESTSSEGKTKTAIPQIIRPWCPPRDSDIHPRQLQIMSQNLPIYVGTLGLDTQTSARLSNQYETLDTSSMQPVAAEDQKDVSRTSSLSSLSGDSGDLCSLNAAEKEPSVSLRSQSGTRSKVRRSKHLRRSMEVVPPDDGHSSDDDNKRNSIQGSRLSQLHLVSVPSSDCEEKGKEDERTREKSGVTPSNAIPDLLEGARIHLEYANGSFSEGRPFHCEVKASGSPKAMTESIELRRGAQLVAAELDDVVDDFTHSSSCFSDLENAKPPSVMGEMSMTSSGLSDLLSNGNGCYMNGKHSADRRRSMKRSKKSNGNHRFVLKTVRQAFSGNSDIPRSAENDNLPSLSGSLENISMKSSGTSEMLENINPPSIMDEISMTNSCTSLNSINSDVLESRSQSLADPNLRSNSEMFQRLNAAAAMVQVYSRELSNIMTGSMRSSFNSDNLDSVNPPSVFQDIAEVTIEDGTEVMTDALGSDSEVEEELPHDDEASVPSDTIHSPHHLLLKEEQIDGSTENLASSIDGDSVGAMEKSSSTTKRISNLALAPQSSSLIDIESNTVQHSLTRSKQFLETTDSEATGIDDVFMESSEQSVTPPPVRRGPRIVKPINRETVRQMQEKKNAEKTVKSIRGRAAPISSRNLLQRLTSTRHTIHSKPAPVTKKAPVPISAVRPTRTSALRASQSQKQGTTKSVVGRVSPRAFLSKPPSASSRSSPRNGGVPPSTNSPHVSSTKTASDRSLSKDKAGEDERPHPPVKQNTFTKDKPSQNAPQISPMSPSNPVLHPEPRMTKSQNDSSVLDQSLPLGSGLKAVNVPPPLESPTGNSPKVGSRKLSFSSSPAVNRSSSNYDGLRRNLSAPIQRKTGSKSGLTSSPSSQSLGKAEEPGKKSLGKRSPSSTSLSGRGGSSTEGRGASASSGSLSSLPSSGVPLRGGGNTREVTSRISSIWKRSESSSSTNSGLTDNTPSIDRSSPAGRSSCTSDPTSSSKTPPVTNRSSTATPTPSQDSITRSATYEKLSKVGEGNMSAKHQSHLRSSVMNPAERNPVRLATGGVKSVSGPKKSSGSSKTSSISPLTKGRGGISGSTKTTKAIPQNIQKKVSRVAGQSIATSRGSEAFTGVHALSSHPPCALEQETRSSSEAKVYQALHPHETKTSPASAVVPPFNYTPSVSIKSGSHDKEKIKINNEAMDSFATSSHACSSVSCDVAGDDEEEEGSESSEVPLDEERCLVTAV